jgi:hypothetical protein
MQEHLENLVSQGHMIVAELATCRVPKDSVSPAPVGGYVMACMVFYERKFGVSSHRFLHSLLWSYDMELHHLTPLRILHMAAFVTLCEAYIWIVPHFNLWSYFFRARTQEQWHMA